MGITFQQIFKTFAVFFLGYTVYSTERAIRNKQNHHQVRRSVDGLSAPATISANLQTPWRQNDFSKVYIMKFKPSEVVFPQDAQERAEFEETFSRSNYTKYQFPDYVNVPLTELGVIYYNGMSFYRQGVETAPEFDFRNRGPDTRTQDAQKCPGKGKSAGEKNEKKEKVETPTMLSDNMLNEPEEPEEPEEEPERRQIGCCNGMPYNTNKRCCCRRASFNKDEKFCCAIGGCGDFKILKKSDDNYDLCKALTGIVVQEYGYHKMTGARDIGFMKEN